MTNSMMMMIMFLTIMLYSFGRRSRLVILSVEDGVLAVLAARNAKCELGVRN